MKSISLGGGNEKLRMLEAFHVVMKSLMFDEKHGEIKNLFSLFNPEGGFTLVAYDSIWEDGSVVPQEIRVHKNGTVEFRKKWRVPEKLKGQNERN